MRDIAVRTGVSRSTVSFVLNDKHDEMGVNEGTRDRVLQAAKELGYRRNGLARAIATGQNPVFVFLVPFFHFESDVVARVLAGTLDEADAHGRTVQVIRLPHGTLDDAVIQRCVEMRPTGAIAIYVPLEPLQHLQRELARFDIPVAVLDSSPPLEGGAHIFSDDIAGCFDAITHLTALGHSRIAFIGGLHGTAASALRDAGYRRAMHSHGLTVPDTYIEYGKWDVEDTERATRQLFLNVAPSPTAVLCADDRTAAIACRTLRTLNLSVPHEVSVVGFADLSIAPLCDPPLTTVAQPFHEMGRAAVRRLLFAAQPSGDELSENTSHGAVEERLPTRLVVRQSTAPVKR